MNPISRRRQFIRRRGSALVWFSLIGIVLILFFGFAVDVAYVALAGHQLQNAADAGALAGAVLVHNPPDTSKAYVNARTVAQSNVVSDAQAHGKVAVQLAPNLANAAGGDIVFGFYDEASHTFTPTLSSPNACQVTARRTADAPGGKLGLIFAPAIGNFFGRDFASASVSKTATAQIGGLIYAGMVLLNKHGEAITLTGTGSRDKILIPNGSVQVNSDSTGAIGFNGNSNIVAKELYVGGNQTNIQNAFSVGHVGINSPPVPDPLAALPVPAHGPNGSSASPLNAGYYPNGLPLSNKGTTVLRSGVYFIRGGISTKNIQTIDATAGVMLYVETGAIDMKGDLLINPMPSGTYAGISIFMARTNASDVALGGNQSTTSPGTFYMPASHFVLKGTPQAVSSQLIADSVEVQGNAQLNINYDQRNPVLGHQVWLVK